MQSSMKTLRLPSFLIFIVCFSFFDINYALNQAECLHKVIWSPRQVTNPQFDASLTVDIDLSQIVTPKSVEYQRKLRRANRITALPGQPEGVNFEQYSGYVTVNEKKGRELFYYFVQSPNNSPSNPLVLWLNGGPGCSSLGYGAMEEIGPFRVNCDQKTLTINKYAWNNVANILFLESPAAVGYSKSDLGIIDENGDKISAKETYIFLLTWLERFPEFKKRDFFIAGESYGGHYIPQLAHIILSKNKLANKTLINLKGVAIGNPFVDTVENRRAQYEYKWHHAFISDEIYNPIRMYCTFKSDNISDETPPCANALRQVDTANIDPYNVYAPICLENSDGSAQHTDDLEAGIDQCIDFYVESYLNDEAVKKAFHVDMNITWFPCVDLNYTDHADTTVPTIIKLLSEGLPVWLYSGDTDSMVPIAATKTSVKAMKHPVKKAWRPWLSNGQVGGYVEEYEGGLTLATVRGAGHMVPSNQPHRAFDLFTYFLQGKSLPEMPKNL